VSILTHDQLRGYIPDTAESDETLDDRIAAAESELARRFGLLDVDGDGNILPTTETFYRTETQFASLVRLKQDAASITSVTEPHDHVLIADTDYRLEGQYLERRWQAWRAPVVVVYVPVDTRVDRRRVLIKLIQLDMNFQPGVKQQGGGPWMESYSVAGYQAEREAIIATLGQQELFA
jgi:hypothetical protein